MIAPFVPQGFPGPADYAEWLRACLRSHARKPGFYVFVDRIPHLQSELARLEKAGY